MTDYFVGEYPLAGRFNTLESEEDNLDLFDLRHDDCKSRVELINEPDNAYDERAVSVRVDNKHVGFIPKTANVPIYHLIEQQFRFFAVFESGEEKRGNEGVWIRVFMEDS